MAKKLKTILVRLSEDQYSQLDNKAQEISKKIGFDISIANLTRKAIAFYLLESNKKEV